MKKILIRHTSGAYPVFIRKNALSAPEQLFSHLDPEHRFFYLIDQNVFRLHNKTIRKLISRKPGCVYFILPSGENSKSYRTLQKIHKALIENHYTRDTVITAIGGGVTGDVGGFAASTYMRGVKIIHIPTTIIAAVDSSIGGKTGINFLNVKNPIGCFYNPVMVIVDPRFLKTLPEIIYNAGLGEIVKYAYLGDEKFYNEVFSKIESILEGDYRKLEEMIVRCIKFKGAVVMKDEKEEGLRKILNFGHSFAHSFESASGFRVPHGLAVNSGIIAALHLSYRKKFISLQVLNTLLKLPLKIPPAPMLKTLDPERIYSYLINDKKNKGREVHFVLCGGPGKIYLDVKAAKKDVIASIKDFQNLI